MSDTSTQELAINLDLTFEDHLACERFHSKVYFRLCMIVGPSLILTGAAIGDFLTSPIRFFLFLLLGLAVGFVEVVRRVLVGYSMWLGGNLPRQMTVTVSNSGLVYTVGEDYRVTSDWPQVRVYETADYFFLWSGKYHLPLPKRCFTPEQIPAFTAALSKHLEQKY
jgi:hypothetical protein